MLVSAAKSEEYRRARSVLPIIILSFVVAVTSHTPALGQQWTHFLMNETDAAGDYLWSNPNNWSNGAPTRSRSVEVGDDSSGRAMHAVIKSDAECASLELAEHGGTEGSTLRLLEGVSLTLYGTATLSKDRESWFYVDGSVYGTGGISEKRSIVAGGPWGRPDLGLPSKSHVLISETGSMDAWFIGINKGYRNPHMATEWYNGPTRPTGSEIVVDGGSLTAREGMRISTYDPNDPGVLRLRGRATFKQNFTPGNFYNQPMYGGIPDLLGVEIWAGTIEIDGKDATIDIQDIYFHGDKHFVDGQAVLRLTGYGVSTIDVTDTANFVDGILDVADLHVRPGTYTVIDAASFVNTNLLFAPGTDTSKWSFQFDTAAGDLLLTYVPEPASALVLLAGLAGAILRRRRF